MTQKKKPEQTSMFTDEEIDALPVEVKNLVDTRIQRTHPRGGALIAAERITKENLAVRLSNVEALVEFLNKAEDLVIKRTKSQDWLLIGDMPYPLESAVKKAHSTIGSKITDLRIEDDRVIEQIQGGDFPVIYYTAYGIVDFNGQKAEAVGTASTKDDFFALRSREVKDENGAPVKDGSRVKKEKYLLRLEDVAIMNVKKKAVTNLYKRGLDLIFRLNPTKEKLAELGINPKSSYGFGTGSQGGSTDTKAEKELRTKLKSLIAKVSDATGQTQIAVLKSVTKYKDYQGAQDPNRVTAKQLPFAVEKLEKMLAGNSQEQ
jgi:hypothetical protein